MELQDIFDNDTLYTDGICDICRRESERRFKHLLTFNRLCLSCKNNYMAMIEMLYSDFNIKYRKK